MAKAYGFDKCVRKASKASNRDDLFKAAISACMINDTYTEPEWRQTEPERVYKEINELLEPERTVSPMSFIKAAIGTIIIYLFGSGTILLYNILMNSSISISLITFIIGLIGVISSVLIIAVQKYFSSMTNDEPEEISEELIEYHTEQQNKLQMKQIELQSKIFDTQMEYIKETFKPTDMQKEPETMSTGQGKMIDAMKAMLTMKDSEPSKILQQIKDLEKEMIKEQIITEKKDDIKPAVGWYMNYDIGMSKLGEELDTFLEEGNNKHCLYCHSILDDDAIFCHYCGTEIENTKKS